MVRPSSGLSDSGRKPFPAHDTAVSVRRERLSVRANAEHVFAEMFAHEDAAFWLDAGSGGSRKSSVLGAASPTRPSYLLHGNVLHRSQGGARMPVGGSLEAALRSWLYSATHGVDTGPLGLVGWFGYEYGARRLGAPVEASPFPDVAMLAADRVVEVDHATGAVDLWFVDDDDGREWACGTADRMRTLATSAPRMPGGVAAVAPPRWRHSDEEYLRMIAACQAAIAAGDAYQLCLTSRAEVTTTSNPVDVFRRLRRISRAAHGAFLKLDDIAVLSASPELFLTVRGGTATTRPVKGTRRRGHDEVEDVALRYELAKDDKERAENLMIVDLMRNDLGRIAEVGGVSVPELLAVETHRHVHQLVSTVHAKLPPGIDAIDVLHSCFPAGSMTGAPKLSAMGILHGLEGSPRGIYSGCLGRLGLDGSAELAMVIRTIVMRGGEASIGSGGGITSLSVPVRELAEVKLKARALLEALGATTGEEWRPESS